MSIKTEDTRINGSDKLDQSFDSKGLDQKNKELDDKKINLLDMKSESSWSPSLKFNSHGMGNWTNHPKGEDSNKPIGLMTLETEHKHSIMSHKMMPTQLNSAQQLRIFEVCYSREAKEEIIDIASFANVYNLLREKNTLPLPPVDVAKRYENYLNDKAPKKTSLKQRLDREHELLKASMEAFENRQRELNK